ncbi:MAG: hypothetical protein Q9M19_06850 [Mariprofundaceae bacterium]|nr:hypothetical protein [Mariprofundaceae bacterium]
MPTPNDDPKFTKHPLTTQITTAGPVTWYEYLPSNQEDCLEQLSDCIQRTWNDNTMTICMKVINAAITKLNLDIAQLQADSRHQTWVNTYWLLYTHGFIAIGYNTVEPAGLVIFSKPLKQLSMKSRKLS